jgi:glyoxylase-like metal-dependent hydrolase (beta-lactamase superfamily II)
MLLRLCCCGCAAADDHGLADVQLSGVLLTHLHMGHYLGLMQFGREAMDWQELQVLNADCARNVYPLLCTFSRHCVS